MKVDVYRGKYAKSLVSVLVPSGSSLDRLPEDVKKLMVDMERMGTLELQAADKRVALDVPVALAELESKGYFVARPTIIIESRDGGPDGRVVGRREIK